jgi:hypothetical protein
VLFYKKIKKTMLTFFKENSPLGYHFNENSLLIYTYMYTQRKISTQRMRIPSCPLDEHLKTGPQWSLI